jgi:photosystem II stability/assembly factor-like uncharacterized protein
MSLRPACSILFVLALSRCSSSTPTDAGLPTDAAPDAGSSDAVVLPDSGGSSDSGTSADAGTTQDAGAPDARTYEQAVMAASWAVLANAPALTDGSKQDDIYFTTPLLGYAVSGPRSSIYKTIDGGDHWSTIKTLPGTYFRSILFVDDTHGFASNLGPIPQTGITDTNVLYRTGDGGSSWTAVSTISGPRPTGICNQHKIDDQHLVAVGRVTGPSYLMSSSDGGQSWTSIDLNSQLQMLIDVHFTSPTEGIVVGGTAANPMRCTILRTTDGSSFETVFTGSVAETLCWKISFPTPDVGYVSIQNPMGAGGPSSFAKTIDGGHTWVEK